MKKRTYRIQWYAVYRGESFVRAESEDEATDLAIEGKDGKFRVIDDHTSVDWEFESVEPEA